MKLRIAISGPTGAGKTALATLLSAELHLPLISEGMGQILHAEAALQADQGRASVGGPHAIAASVQAYSNRYFEWFHERGLAYSAQSNGFVADRWEADLLDTWLIKLGMTGHDTTSSQLFKAMVEKSRMLDVVVMLPFMAPLGGASNEAGLRRAGGYSARLVKQALTRGLMQMCPDLRIIDLPPHPWTAQQRVEFLLPLLQHIERALPSVQINHGL